MSVLNILMVFIWYIWLECYFMLNVIKIYLFFIIFINSIFYFASLNKFIFVVLIFAKLLHWNWTWKNETPCNWFVFMTNGSYFLGDIWNLKNPFEKANSILLYRRNSLHFYSLRLCICKIQFLIVVISSKYKILC